MLGTKLNKQITIKPRLDLTKFASRKTPGEQLTYHLVAMVTHLGASQHCGHYTAIGLTESGTYYNYDDSYVRPISMQNVCNTNAYIIFYEMDTQPPRIVTSTQVSGAQATTVSGNQKDTSGQVLKINGHINSGGPQKIIGPQLPSGFNTNASPVTSSNPSPLLNGGNKLILNRNSTSNSLASSSSNSLNSSGNSKIMIHFKNNSSNNSSNLVKTSAATSSITTASATSTSSSSTFDNLKNGNGIANCNGNGLHLSGTGKFQESANTKYSLGISTSKRQVNNIKNRNESSSDDDDEDEIVSSSTSSHNATQATLPSMPKLGVESSTNTTPTSILNAHSTTTSSKSLVNSIVKKSPAPIKSLVPYGSETEDETDVCMVSATKSTVVAPEQQKRLLLPNPLKRRQSSSSSSSSSSDNDVDTNDRDVKPTNGIKIKKAASSTSNNSSVSSKSPTKLMEPLKKASETIDEIFNISKRSNNTNNNINSTSSGISSLKKKSQNQQFTVTSTTTNSADFSSTSSESEDESGAKTKSTRPPFKRSHSTPPSPPVVKTNSGIWQVTSLQPITACVSPTTPTSSSNFPTPAVSEKAPKNPKNPFAKQPAPLITENNKRLKKESSNKTFVGNGYQRNVSGNESAVTELLKQSHRGYGTPVLTWNGQQSEIDKEVSVTYKFTNSIL